jgi:hypothetical protein
LFLIPRFRKSSWEFFTPGQEFIVPAARMARLSKNKPKSLEKRIRDSSSNLKLGDFSLKTCKKKILFSNNVIDKKKREREGLGI